MSNEPMKTPKLLDILRYRKTEMSFVVQENVWNDEDEMLFVTIAKDYSVNLFEVNMLCVMLNISQEKTDIYINDDNKVVVTFVLKEGVKENG